MFNRNIKQASFACVWKERAGETKRAEVCQDNTQSLSKEQSLHVTFWQGDEKKLRDSTTTLKTTLSMISYTDPQPVLRGLCAQLRSRRGLEFSAVTWVRALQITRPERFPPRLPHRPWFAFLCLDTDTGEYFRSPNGPSCGFPV